MAKSRQRGLGAEPNLAVGLQPAASTIGGSGGPVRLGARTLGQDLDLVGSLSQTARTLAQVAKTAKEAKEKGKDDKEAAQAVDFASPREGESDSSVLARLGEEFARLKRENPEIDVSDFGTFHKGAQILQARKLLRLAAQEIETNKAEFLDFITTDGFFKDGTIDPIESTNRFLSEQLDLIRNHPTVGTVFRNQEFELGAERLLAQLTPALQKEVKDKIKGVAEQDFDDDIGDALSKAITSNNGDTSPDFIKALESTIQETGRHGVIVEGVPERVANVIARVALGAARQGEGESAKRLVENLLDDKNGLRNNKTFLGKDGSTTETFLLKTLDEIEDQIEDDQESLDQRERLQDLSDRRLASRGAAALLNKLEGENLEGRAKLAEALTRVDEDETIVGDTLKGFFKKEIRQQWREQLGIEELVIPDRDVLRQISKATHEGRFDDAEVLVQALEVSKGISATQASKVREEIEEGRDPAQKLKDSTAFAEGSELVSGIFQTTGGGLVAHDGGIKEQNSLDELRVFAFSLAQGEEIPPAQFEAEVRGFAQKIRERDLEIEGKRLAGVAELQSEVTRSRQTGEPLEDRINSNEFIDERTKGNLLYNNALGAATISSQRVNFRKNVLDKIAGAVVTETGTDTVIGRREAEKLVREEFEGAIDEAFDKAASSPGSLPENLDKAFRDLTEQPIDKVVAGTSEIVEEVKDVDENSKNLLLMKEASRERLTASEFTEAAMEKGGMFLQDRAVSSLYLRITRDKLDGGFFSRRRIQSSIDGELLHSLREAPSEAKDKAFASMLSMRGIEAKWILESKIDFKESFGISKFATNQFVEQGIETSFDIPEDIPAFSTMIDFRSLSNEKDPYKALRSFAKSSPNKLEKVMDLRGVLPEQRDDWLKAQKYLYGIYFPNFEPGLDK